LYSIYYEQYYLIGLIAGKQMLKKLCRDQSGQALVMVSIMLPVMLGFVGLAIEGSRYMALHSQLQDLADAAALAGAKKLTGTSTSIADARAAVADFATRNWPWLSNDGETNGDSQIASSDIHVCADIASSPCTDTTDYTAARYVQVTSVARGIVPAFLTAVGGAAQTTRATATAESITVACNVQPLMLCNPFEGTTKPNFSDNVTAGVMFQLKVLGSGNPSTPGDFALLDPPNDTSSGASLIEQLLSQQSPNFCYIDSASPHPGQAVQKVNNGINVRFDLNPNGSGGPTLDSSPAPIVIKGSKSCSANNWSNTQNNLGDNWRMPLDKTMTPYPNTTFSLGSGGIDPTTANAYWLAHHGSGTWPTDPTTGALMSRYNVYLKEIDGTYPFTPSSATSTPAGYEEAPAPSCTAANSETKADRRILSVAIIDCIAHPFNGNSTPQIQSNAYANFFITRPSVSGSVYAEFVEMMTPDTAGSKLKQIVQLVRDQ
jgi:Flp pilus assembly protein TadG